MKTSVYASVHADIYAEKIRVWKERDVSLQISSFIKGDFKKEKCHFFLFFFFSVSSSLVFQAGNGVGK